MDIKYKKHTTFIRRAIQLSAQCYRDESVDDGVIIQDAETGGYATVRTESTGSKAITFRGTDSMLDCRMNLMRYRTTFPYVPQKPLVHTGVLTQYEKLRPEIMNFVASSSTSTDFLITGHSLGGALATLCTLDIAVNYPEAHVRCYPLNAPRVGDKILVNTLSNLSNVEILRINTKYDLIPRVPLIGFTHTRNVLELSIPSHYGLWWFHCRRRHSINILETVWTDQMRLGFPPLLS